nr:RNA-directed DNA polymerase, eukaryota [Tanacetum cinerariifolium]
MLNSCGQVSRKQILWDYVSTLIDRWNGEVVVLGDFNEVRNIEKGVGYTFTWSHPSGSKMSKLDRFLVSEGIFLIFPSITAVCLDRHLSDHRPIILYEVQADFGPIPFWFYHSWISLKGFDAMVEQTWRSFSHNDANRMIRFKKRFRTSSKRLSDVQASDLERRVYRDEIRLAVWNCGENKSPGPDGYSFEFFRKYWNLVGSDFCDVVEHFFETGSFSNGCNSSFVALISKITDAKFVNNFRPISLIWSVYKVVTKRLSGLVTFGASGFGELSALLRPQFW